MGKIVGEYRFIKTLGEGSFSKVKQAVHIPTHKEYAIKIIDRQIVLQNDIGAQLNREINIMSHMDHPGIIKLHAVMHTDKNLYLVLDLAEGGELFSKLAQDGPLNEKTARSYFQQLIDALDYMHKRNAIHRDLKPENLLLDKEGNLKIADFGLSILAQSPNDMLKTRCGTPNYVAPEVLSQDSYLGPSADIWSAGVILFVMLAAALPFDAPTLPELAQQILHVKIDYPASFPMAAVDLLRSILVADPTKRFNIEQIRQHPWFKINYQPRISTSDGHPIIDQEVTVSAAPKPGAESKSINAFELVAKISSVNIERLIDQTVPVNASTSFSVSKPVDQIKRIIIQTLQGLKGTVAEGKSQNAVKAVVPIGNNSISIRIEIHSLSGNSFLVETCRLKGSQFDFLRIFRSLKQRLG